LPADRDILQFIDFQSAAQHLDFLNLEAFGMYNAESPRSGHQSQLYSMTREEVSGSIAVAFVMSRGFPGQSILLGVPTAARSFLRCEGLDREFDGVGGENGLIDYSELPQSGCTEIVDRRRIAAFCTGGDGGFVTYDNPETTEEKADFCKQKRLGVSNFGHFWFSEYCAKSPNTSVGSVLFRRFGRFAG
jgi:chitinase